MEFEAGGAGEGGVGGGFVGKNMFLKTKETSK